VKEGQNGQREKRKKEKTYSPRAIAEVTIAMELWTKKGQEEVNAGRSGL
jgi:hypothetical protein